MAGDELGLALYSLKMERMSTREAPGMGSVGVEANLATTSTCHGRPVERRTVASWRACREPAEMVGGVTGPHARCVEAASRFGEARLGAKLRNRARRSCEQGWCGVARGGRCQRGEGWVQKSAGGVGGAPRRRGRGKTHGGRWRRAPRRLEVEDE